MGVNRIPSAKNFLDLKKNYNLEYIAPINLKTIAERKLYFDASISSTTLEHLPEKELKESFNLLKKIIKKDGIILAAIDYSDHYSHTDKNINLYGEVLNDVFGIIAKCESDALNIDELLDGPVCHSGFKRLN